MLAASPRAQDGVPMFRTSVDVVTIDAFAHKDRKPIGNLAARDFLVRDNGVEQVVDSLGTTDSAHVIIGLDLSGSVDGRTLQQLRAAVRSLVGELTPQDRVSLFTFSDRLRLLMRAIPPGGSLETTLARFEAAGATPLHDAIVFGSALSFADQRPSVFLLFTDGQDTASWTS
ncbi:MAG TPA: VWA domain-containing protein, partial [Vicinamibacterales bacterium]|nr:VWA domain-containing protein [Vicinamibacterales bacterium]